MEMKSIVLATSAFVTFSATAYAAGTESYESTTKIEKDANGNYSEKTTTTKKEADGTINSSEVKLDIKADGKGNTDKSKTVERITDPKGIGNKHIIKITDSEKTVGGQVTTTHTKTVDGKNVEGTNDNYKTSSKIQSDSNGNYAERDITTKVDSDGTATSYEENAKVLVDTNGDTSKSTTTKHVTDPVGLMNKSVVSTSNVENVKDGLIKSNQKVTIDGKTVESSSETSKQ